jgi:hypothetical protein
MMAMIRMVKMQTMGLGAALFLAPVGGFAQNPSPVATAPPPFTIQAENAAYADIADLVTIAPMIVDAVVFKATKVAPEQAVGVPITLQRMVIEADVLALIRGNSGVASRVKFLIDIPKDAKGKVPKLKKMRVFIMARDVAGRPGEIQLVRPGALVSYSAANDVTVRAITKEVVQLDAPQRITGIASAFYSPGTIMGDGQTQIFLTTERNQPLALSISSRAGQQKIWSVSTSEVIEEGAMAPARYTLMWYRLACGLPRTLAPEQVESNDSANAAWAQADYQYVLEALGPCGRRR